MGIRLFAAGKLVEDLAARRVPPREQATYLTISFLAWIVAYYLYLIPSPLTTDPVILAWVWLIEFSLVTLLFVTGIAYCLGKCRVDPQTNFLVDFSCLYAPVSLASLLVIWGVFHLLTLPAWFFLPMGSWPWAVVYDALRLAFYAVTIFVIFRRVGARMEQVSLARQATR